MSSSRLRTCCSGTHTGENDEDSCSFYIMARRTPLGRWLQQQRDLQRLSQPRASNLRPEHFLEVVILLDVRCLLFPSISILSKRHPTKVMGFATLQLQNKNRTLKTLRADGRSFSSIRLRGNQNSITSCKSLNRTGGH